MPLCQSSLPTGNTGSPEVSEMFDNALALYLLPPVDDSFQPFFGAEGLDDIEVDAVPTTDLPPSVANARN
jgi:hypothetical protein